MTSRKLSTIFKYVLTLVILVYSCVRGSIYLVRALDGVKNPNLIGAILYYLIAVTSVVVLIILIRKSIYRAKFTHNDFE